jgi:hypothetical protein
MTNGDLPDNINIPPSYQNRPSKPMPGKDQKSKPKNGGRKATPNGDKKCRDPNSKPSVKKPKIIESIKLHFVQQYFRASEMVYQYENPEAAEYAIPYAFYDEGDEGENKPDEEAEEEIQEDKEEEPEDKQEEEEMEKEEREPEEHEEYIPEEAEEKESSHSFEPYDPTDVMEIEVKVSTKVKGLKKMILDKIDLYKKANIILLKKAEIVSKPIESAPMSATWVEMTEADMDQPVKIFMNQCIAFKAYMEISVCVEGRGQSYHQ